MHDEDILKILEKYISNYILINKDNDQILNAISPKKLAMKIKTDNPNIFKNIADNYQGDLSEAIKNDLNSLIEEEKRIREKKALEFLNKLKEIETKYSEIEESDISLVDFDVKTNGLYIDNHQINLLRIIELDKSDSLSFIDACYQYIDNCSQYINKKELKSRIFSIKDDQEAVKRLLFDEYNKSLKDYLEVTLEEKTSEFGRYIKIINKLKKFGIYSNEIEEYIKNNDIEGLNNEIINKYGEEVLKRIHRFIYDDHSNSKEISYEEIESLSKLINNQGVDQIIIGQGKFIECMIPGKNRYEFDSYHIDEAVEYCKKHGIKVRYHTLIDYQLAETFHLQGLDKNTVLRYLEQYIKESFNYINKVNEDGIVIDKIEIFNELVEKLKDNPNEEYHMIWEKYFGITIEELMGLIKSVEKPINVQYMYNETTLSESKLKQDKVFDVFDKIKDLIDIFGDQMHLSSKDVIRNKNNLIGNAKLLRRIKEAKSDINIEVTEFDFLLEPSFLEKIDFLNKIGYNIEPWRLKQLLQMEAAQVFKDENVEFSSVAYWSIFDKNNHEVIRKNKELGEKKYSSFYGSLVKPNRTIPLSIKQKRIINKQTDSIKTPKKEKNDPSESALLKSFESKKNDRKAEALDTTNLSSEKKATYERQSKNIERKTVKKLELKTEGQEGYTSSLILYIIISFVSGIIFTFIYMNFR